MTYSRIVLLSLLLLSACKDDPGQPGSQAHPLPEITSATLMTHVSRLAHDSMLGRGSGTADERRAAVYIANEFVSYGLQGSDIAPFPVPPDRAGGQTEVVSQNVIGVLPGIGLLAGQWIVLGAHYDHVGALGTTIFNGADDNASGTALIMEVARLLTTHASSGGFGDAPRRSVMFIAFGAEELGLVGSEHYCAQPRVALTSVAAMLNFDMVGRLRNKSLGVGGLGTALEWSGLLAQQNSDQLVIQANDCDACTDYACFRRANRPSLWFFTGFHNEYHQPGDDVALIEPDGLADVANLAARVTADLMVRAQAPVFREN